MLGESTWTKTTCRSSTSNKTTTNVIEDQIELVCVVNFSLFLSPFYAECFSFRFLSWKLGIVLLCVCVCDLFLLLWTIYRLTCSVMCYWSISFIIVCFFFLKKSFIYENKTQECLMSMKSEKKYDEWFMIIVSLVCPTAYFCFSSDWRYRI